MKIRPFKGVRPPEKLAAEVAARPYDVLNSDEARKEAGEKSLLHITKPEIDFAPGTDEHSEAVYDKAVENYGKWKERGWLVQDDVPSYYIYAQTMDGRTQYGLVAGASVEDYLDGKIKKHELTRRDKEEDRMKHVRNQSANIEPVFFAYPASAEMDRIVAEVTKGRPEYEFVAPDDGFGHKFWVVDPSFTDSITAIFEKMPAMYVADGHHRTAAAALVGQERAKANPHHTGDEEYNYFLAVIFPDDQLKIIDYNRVVKDLNGLSEAEFLAALADDFVVTSADGKEPYKPTGLHNFGMYLGGRWYSLTAREGTYDDSDPIGVLDVTVLSNLVLDKVLGIKDLRTDNRIDFVGGIRGLGELSRRVDSGEMAVAFALYPVSMEQLITIADTGNIMPPKTTWFEPKLRSGLVIHEF